MASNASPHGVRNAVLNSRVREFADYRVAIDCGTSNCAGERTFELAQIARMYDPGMLTGVLVSRLRCSRCGGIPARCSIETGPELAARARIRRMALVGPGSGEHER